MTSPARKTLAEHINAAYVASARRLLDAAAPDVAPFLREQLATEEAVQAYYARLDVEVVADRDAKGRIDNRSTRVIVWMGGTEGPVHVVDVLARELVDQAGEPIDAKATARDLRAQVRPVTDADLARLLDEEAGR